MLKRRTLNRRLIAALMPAALVCGSAAHQAAAQVTPRPARTASDNMSEMNLPGPDGEDALRVTKDAPRQIRLGQEFNYNITVTNVSDSPIRGVTVVEDHTGLKVRQANAKNGNQNKNPRGQAQQDGDSIRFQVGDLAAGASKTLAVTAVADQKGRANSCLRVEYSPTLCSMFEVVEPDFKLVATLLMDRDLLLKQDKNVDGIYRCDRLLLDVKLTSTGDVATAPATLKLDLPEGVMTEDGKNQINMDVGAIAPNQTVSKRIPLNLDPQKSGEDINITAMAMAGELNAKVELPAVKVLDPALELMVDGGGDAYVGRNKTVKVTVRNPSDDPVLDARVKMANLEPRTFQIDGADVDVNGLVALGRLNGGQSRTFNVTMMSTEPRDLAFTAKVDGYCVRAIEKKATVSFVGIAAILLEVIDQKDPVPVGENTTYEIKVKNQGSAVDNNVQLSATLPEGVSFVEGRGETKITANGKNITFAKMTSLEPGDVASWYVTIKAEKANKAKFQVKLTSEANPEPVMETEPTTLY